jgi:hypothetical protein
MTNIARRHHGREGGLPGGRGAQRQHRGRRSRLRASVPCSAGGLRGCPLPGQPLHQLHVPLHREPLQVRVSLTAHGFAPVNQKCIGIKRRMCNTVREERSITSAPSCAKWCCRPTQLTTASIKSHIAKNSHRCLCLEFSLFVLAPSLHMGLKVYSNTTNICRFFPLTSLLVAESHHVAP